MCKLRSVQNHVFAIYLVQFACAERSSGNKRGIVYICLETQPIQNITNAHSIVCIHFSVVVSVEKEQMLTYIVKKSVLNDHELVIRCSYRSKFWLICALRLFCFCFLIYLRFYFNGAHNSLSNT